MSSSLEFLSQVLVCPFTGSPLEIQNGGLYSPKVKKAYLNVDEIPWFYRDDFQNLVQWQNRATSLFDHHIILAERIATELGQIDLLPATKARLELLQVHHVEQASFLSELSKDLISKIKNDLPEVLNTLFYEKVPRQQTANAYAQTVYRDWAWGEKEIRAQTELLIPFFSSTKSLLVLGAGACGLPVSIHKKLNLQNTLAVDINPLLLSTAKRILSGVDTDLVEFPRIPVESKYAAIRHHVKGQKLNNFHFLFADAQDLSLKPGSFDTVLTPWFIDIVPRDFKDLARKINSHLTNDQKWVNIGLLGFEKNKQSEVFTPDEVKEVLEESGFEIEAWETRELPYLYSPFSAVKRTDTVFAFSAVKKKSAKQPPRYQYLPEWLLDTNLPIPQNESIKMYQFKSDLYLRVLSYIDGKNSLEQVAKLFAQNTQLPIDGSRVSIFNFLVNVYENVIYREF